MYKSQRNLFYLALFVITILFSACSSSSDDGDGDGSTTTPADPAKGSDWDKMEWDKGQWK